MLNDNKKQKQKLEDTLQNLRNTVDVFRYCQINKDQNTSYTKHAAEIKTSSLEKCQQANLLLYFAGRSSWWQEIKSFSIKCVYMYVYVWVRARRDDESFYSITEFENQQT